MFYWTNWMHGVDAWKDMVDGSDMIRYPTRDYLAPASIWLRERGQWLKKDQQFRYVSDHLFEKPLDQLHILCTR